MDMSFSDAYGVHVSRYAAFASAPPLFLDQNNVIQYAEYVPVWAAK